MDSRSLGKTFPEERMSPVRDFLNDNPHLLSKLTPASQDAYLEICSSIYRKASRSRVFFINTFKNIEDVDLSPLRDLILRGALILSACNLALVQPYFYAVRSLSEDADFIERWTQFVRDLASWDIDVAVAFLNQTPRAKETFGIDNLLLWGEQALEALRIGQRMWKAARAYLEEAVADRRAVPQWRWKFFLEQAVQISEVSSSAAEAFIRLGSRACLVLNDKEAEQWVSEGLTGCGTEEELINYFSSISLKALEKRDRLASWVTLKERGNTLSLICEAYLGHPIKVWSSTSLIGVNGFTGGAATDGRTIYLPDIVPTFELFTLMALHQSILSEKEGWRYESGEGTFNPVRIHLDTDSRLLERLPVLLTEMERVTEGSLPESYPSGAPEDFLESLPWWGDLLPELVCETDSTIQQLKERAAEHLELAPEVVESLVSVMMAEGQRDVEKLWDRLVEMFMSDSTGLTSPDLEELQDDIKTFYYKEFLYKEWDEDLSDYKLGWCLVRQRMAKDNPNSFVEEVRTRLPGLITLIRRQFMKLKPERFQKFRAQPMGDELDIEALIPAFADMYSGSFLSENVYIRRDKRVRDVAVMFLLDMSGSTGAKVNDRRVIDIQKEAMVLMAEALDSLEDPYSVFGFSSEGRFKVDLFTIKDFGEPYGERAQYRLGSLEPRGFTRLGAVIRHGIYKLDRVQAIIKLMMILTDGRPYDLGYGSVDYAIADTKKAIQEARRHRIHPFIITSDQKGASYLRRISPQTLSIILPRAELLPTMLPSIYKRLTG